MRIGSIESFTGGAFASKIVEKAGSSHYYAGSVIAYSNKLKEKIGVDISNGVINATTAYQMSMKGKEYLDVDYCFSFTGNAGPEVIEGKPVGLVFIGINEKIYELNLEGNRIEIINQAVDFAISKWEAIQNF